MKAVTWLTNTVNWEELKISGSNTAISSSINYIVGSPSLEMMMDSYNTKYALTGEKPDYSNIEVGTRKKLFYKYPLNDNRWGYGIGPYAYDGVEYDSFTSSNSVQSDSEIDSMYYPGGDVSRNYWLASPSSLGTSWSDVVVVESHSGGRLGIPEYGSMSVCPLVSLKFDAGLELAN